MLGLLSLEWMKLEGCNFAQLLLATVNVTSCKYLVTVALNFLNKAHYLSRDPRITQNSLLGKKMSRQVMCRQIQSTNPQHSESTTEKDFYFDGLSSLKLMAMISLNPEQKSRKQENNS